jgi:hypothetical protein
VIGMTETIGNTGTFPSLTITEDNPLALHHATMTLFNTAREFSEVTLRINNRLDAQSFNTEAVTSIQPGDTREITPGRIRDVWTEPKNRSNKPGLRG